MTSLETMNERTATLAASPEWKALQAHYESVKGLQLAGAVRRRSEAQRAVQPRGGRPLPRLFEEPHHRRDPSPARRSRPRTKASRSGGTRCSPARRSTSAKTAPSCMSRCGRRGAERSSSTARTSCPRFTRCSTGWRLSRTRCGRAPGRATAASASATSINIGIGGSYLGPEMAYRALREFCDPGLTVRFVANVDGADFDRGDRRVSIRTRRCSSSPRRPSRRWRR